MNLLVTGGAGFIGANVIGHIIDRPEIRRLINLDCLTYAGHLDNLSSVAHHPKYVFEKADLRDAAAVGEVFRKHTVSHVLHLAAESHVDRSIRCPGDFIHTNVIGTFHLLEACRAAWLGPTAPRRAPDGEHRFHHVSTDEVYGSVAPSARSTETSVYAPSSPYSASKAASDLLVRSYHHTYGLPAVITNCSNNYGPYQFPEKLIPVIILNALAGRSIPVYGDGQHVRDWLYVRDHAEALWQVLTRGRDGETYNISAENPWSNMRLAEYLCDLIDATAGRPAGQSRRLIALVADRPGHDRCYAIDANKIRAELGWAPACSFERGLVETVEWYRQHQDWVRRVGTGPADAEKTVDSPWGVN